MSNEPNALTVNRSPSMLSYIELVHLVSSSPPNSNRRLVAKLDILLKFLNQYFIQFFFCSLFKPPFPCYTQKSIGIPQDRSNLWSFQLLLTCKSLIYIFFSTVPFRHSFYTLVVQLKLNAVNRNINFRWIYRLQKSEVKTRNPHKSKTASNSLTLVLYNQYDYFVYKFFYAYSLAKHCSFWPTKYEL